MRKERKILRFVPQILRKSFANGNPTLIGLEALPESRNKDAQCFYEIYIFKM